MRIPLALALVLALLAVPAIPVLAADLKIANGGFDQGLSGWTSSHSSGGTAAVTWQGRTSARIADADGGKAYGLESTPGLTATANTRYVVYAKVWVDTGSPDLYVRFHGSSGQVLGSGYTHVAGPTVGWADVQAAGTAPVGTTSVSALVYSGVGNQGTAYWDDILISKADTDLGVQLESSVPNATTFAGGQVYGLYTGTADTNPQLAVIDMASEAVTKKIAIPDTASAPTVGGWAATTSTDGTVYLGTYPNSKLYSYVPGQSAVTDLGRAEGGYSVIFGLAPGANGKIYGGSYNGGQYFKYDNGKFSSIASPVWGTVEYVRSIAHDPVANASYLGVGTNAALIRFDNVTGDRSDLLPPAYAVNSMVGGVTWTGGRLFAWVDRTLLVLNVIKNADGTYRATTDATITDVDLHISDARDGKVWFVKDGYLCSYDLAARTWQQTTVQPGLDVTGYGWVGGTLVGLGASPEGTKIFKYTPATGQATTHLVQGTPVLPAAINALGAGPDGKIYTGGYLTGGTGSYDPLRGDADDTRPDRETLAGLTQTDSMKTINGKLYFGTYPSARLYQYDPADPWPPTKLYEGGHAGNKADDCANGDDPPPQDRPYALAGSPDGTIYMGTVPKYGKRSGALNIWKPGSPGRTLCVVRDQAVVSLAYSGGKIYGGTSTRGALGVTPVLAPGASATLFDYDPVTDAVTPHPLPAAIVNRQAITAVAEVDGKIWGFAEGWLFVYDPASGTWPTVKQLFTVDYTQNTASAWRDANLVTIKQDPASVYGSIGDQLFKIDKATKTMTVLLTAGGMEGLATDSYGNLYYRIGERLHRFAAF